MDVNENHDQLDEIVERENIAIISAGRTGSLMLFSLLNQLDEFVGSPKKEFLNVQGHAGKFSKENFGNLKLFVDDHKDKFVFTHIKINTEPIIFNNRAIQIGKLIKKLKQIGFTKFVFLRRKNIVRSILSKHRGVKTFWHTTSQDAYTKIPKIKVNSSYYYSEVIQRLRFEKTLVKCFEKQKTEFIEIVYEDDLLKDNTIGLKKILQFVSVPYPSEFPTTDYKRTNPQSVKSCIKNYADLNNMFERSPYLWMIKE